MKILRKWAMPNKYTFSIKPIEELITTYLNTIPKINPVIIDAFANNSKIATITNDLDLTYDTTYHLDALELFANV